MSKKITSKRLRKLVHQLVSEHREFGLKSLNLAIWYGDREKMTHVHLFEAISGLPSAIEDEFEPIVYPPSKDFPIFLSAIVVAPTDVERAVKRKDPFLTEVIKSQPEVIFMDNQGKKLWEQIKTCENEKTHGMPSSSRFSPASSSVWESN